MLNGAIHISSNTPIYFLLTFFVKKGSKTDFWKAKIIAKNVFTKAYVIPLKN